MADIKVRIELNENAESEKIGSVKTDNLTFANTSIRANSVGVFNNIPTRDNITKGINALTFGQGLYFNENGVLDNVDGYGAGLDSENNKFEIVWGIVNSDNTYNVKITFENSQNLKDIVIYGDKESNQFPTRAILDGTTEVFSDDHIWTLQFPNESDTHTIEFTHWKRANYNAVLTFIGVMLKYIEIDKRNGLKSIESLSQSTGQPKEIFYGVVPSTGALEIIDVNGEIADMVRDGIISKSGFNVELFANGKQIQKHLSSSNEYKMTSGSNNFKIELNNSLSNWENINFNGYKLNIEKSLYEILLDVLSVKYQQVEIDEMFTTKMVGVNNTEQTVKDYLQNIKIKHPYIKSGTLRETIDKICTIAQLNVHENDSGKIKFTSARPITTKSNNIIKLTKKNQESEFDIGLVVNNKYKSANVNYFKTKLIDKNLDTRTIKYYGYDTISKAIKDYYYVIDNESVNPNIEVIRYRIKSPNNPTDPYSGNHWYYYMAKFDVSYDVTDLKILTNFKPKIKDNVTMIFPDDKSPIRTSDTTTHILDYYDSSYSDEDMANLWYDANGNFKPVNFDFKVRKNEDETFSVFYVSLLLITTKDIAYAGANEETILAIYNELNISFIAPEIEQESASLIDNAEITINSNELLQDTATIGGESLPITIQKNILFDYSNGISTGSLDINCLDYFDISGKKIKDWNSGQIVNIGDIVRVDKDNLGNSAITYSNKEDVYFKVVGRNFRKNGVPLLELQLQEVQLLS